MTKSFEGWKADLDQKVQKVQDDLAAQLVAIDAQAESSRQVARSDAQVLLGSLAAQNTLLDRMIVDRDVQPAQGVTLYGNPSTIAEATVDPQVSEGGPT